MPRSSASADNASIGSITPCGYDGAEPTRSTVRSSIAAAMALASARMSAPTGTLTASTPRQCAALSNAAWAEVGRTMRGAVIAARSRCALTASMIDSVPPLVTTPPTSSSPPSRSAVMATISASSFVVLGHRSTCSGLCWECSA